MRPRKLLTPGITFLAKLFLRIVRMAARKSPFMKHNIHCARLLSSETNKYKKCKITSVLKPESCVILLAWLITGSVVAPLRSHYRPYTRRVEASRTRVLLERRLRNSKSFYRSQCKFALRAKLRISLLLCHRLVQRDAFVIGHSLRRVIRNEYNQRNPYACRTLALCLVNLVVPRFSRWIRTAVPASARKRTIRRSATTESLDSGCYRGAIKRAIAVAFGCPG